MVSVASLASRAFDRLNAGLTDAVKACTLTHTTQGAYDPVTGTYTTVTTTTTGRAIFDVSRPIADAFPAYVAGPADKLAILEGLDFAPVETDTLTIASVDHTIKAVADIAGAGSTFSVVIA
ncbi:hypothetical protein [Sinorhizobium fredii]|uniref:hypothetical protein n=1 Tax=Rhizobium fredii TaxID=380 RepID=UPI0004B559A6|nr:hypothetical protein [Sinorhizobium fredii]